MSSTALAHETEIKAPAADAVPIYTTQTPAEKCGYFEVKGENNHDGRFVGTIDVYTVDHSHDGSNGSANKPPTYKLAGHIAVSGHATQVNVLASEGHDAITVLLPALRRTREALTDHNGEQNVAYQIARTIAENTGRSTDEVRSWLNQFDNSLRYRDQAQLNGEWVPHGHYF
jgi:hypothetical protein